MIIPLEIIIPRSDDFWNPDTEEFVSYPETVLKLNHCLLSISKWEAIWKRPFIQPQYSDKRMSTEEIISYIRCMSDEPVPDHVIQRITKDMIDEIINYTKDQKTATKIKPRPGGHSSEAITSELLYFYLSAFGMPFDICEQWHLSRLLTLIQIADHKNTPPKKMGKAATMRSNAAINKTRRAGRPG